MRIPLGLSYDDVLLVPQKTDISSRSLVDTSSFLTKNIKIDIPIVSANMDTVTESDMAITMAMAGGIGVIHRFLTIEEQAGEVERVKRHDGFMVDQPRTIAPEDSLKMVWEMIERFGSTGFVVVDEQNKILGLLSKRDFVFETDLRTPVAKLMTPAAKLIIAKPKTTREEARTIFKKYKIEKLPVTDKEGKLVSLITAKSLFNEEKYPYSSRDRRGRLLVGAAVGIKEGDKDRAKELVQAGADVIVVDIAHGHAESVLEMTRFLKKNFSVAVMAGNVATPEGVADLVRVGADAVKVGIGAGAVCITRIVAGSGYPQFSAVLECAAEAKKWKLPIIADQSIRTGGDVAKAMGAGAGTVMVGSLLAGTDESPGSIVVRNGRKYKISRGMASLGANMARKIKDGAREKVLEELKEYVAEGVEAMVPYKGKTEEILSQLVGGLKSGMSYSGAKNIIDFQKKAKFVQVTNAGIKEGGAHDVEVL
ncbi:MAG: IMP dehydrogenase [Patescibacteria group bacterium]|mgnify:CR=1 FL=1